MQDPEGTLEAWLGSVASLPAWGARSGYGSWIRINFGEPSLVDRDVQPDDPPAPEDVEGEFQLFVELADWTLDGAATSGVTSEAPRPAIKNAVAQLDGQKLTRVSISSAPPTTTFEFDRGAVLSLCAYPDASSDDDLWHLFHASEELSLEASGALVLVNHRGGAESRCRPSRYEFAA